MEFIRRNRDNDADYTADQLETANQLEHNGWDFEGASPYDSEERSGPYLRYSYPPSRFVTILPDGTIR